MKIINANKEEIVIQFDSIFHKKIRARRVSNFIHAYDKLNALKKK